MLLGFQLLHDLRHHGAVHARQAARDSGRRPAGLTRWVPAGRPEDGMTGAIGWAVTAASRERAQHQLVSGGYQACQSAPPACSSGVRFGDFSPVLVSEGDLNTETDAISPDRGNHAIRVTRPRQTHPGIPRCIRYLVRYLACTWLCGRCRASAPPPSAAAVPRGCSAAELRGPVRATFRGGRSDAHAQVTAQLRKSPSAPECSSPAVRQAHGTP